MSVTYLQEIINNLENKIQELENRKNVQKTKVFKKCKFFNTGFCKSRDNCPFQHPASLCREHLEDGKCSSFRTCQHRHPRECRYFKRVKSCFHGESCAYLHKESNALKETSTNEEKEDNTVKLVTIEVNGKKATVEKLEDLDEEITNAMTADDFLKFCDNIEHEKTSVADEEVFVDLDFIEEELRKSIYLNVDNGDVMKDNSKTVKPQNTNLKKSSRKKLSSVKK